MDFVYDKLQGGIETPPANEPSKETASSLDEAADKLEVGIEKAYERVSDKNTWNTLWTSFKERGAAALAETRKEVDSVRTELNSYLESQNSRQTTPNASGEDAGSSSTETLKGATSPASGAQSGENKTLMLGELTKKAQGYIDGLDRDLEKIENLAGSYLTKFGKDLRTVLRDAVTVSGPFSDGDRASNSDFSDGEDATSDILFNVPEDIRNQIYSTRLDAQLHALHTSKEPFLATSEDSGFSKFKDTFQVSQHTDEIAKDLETYTSLRTLMESLVPDQVSYEDFWTRYYYMRQQISDQEKKRRELLKQASTEEDELGWDDDDDENEADAPATDAKPKAGSSRPSSESSYDLVSKNSSRTDLKQDSGAKGGDDDDDDDDWE
uniref:ARAD1C05148p n=1 Tax=Blastobotrys adeninivorans TaxID=409370 RepID=A0A060T038_BLAAD